MSAPLPPPLPKKRRPYLTIQTAPCSYSIGHFPRSPSSSLLVARSPSSSLLFTSVSPYRDAFGASPPILPQPYPSLVVRPPPVHIPSKNEAVPLGRFALATIGEMTSYELDGEFAKIKERPKRGLNFSSPFPLPFSPPVSPIHKSSKRQLV
ncbi:hypothetical protein BASA81_008456 [Batrachochytrium salamandrivorans]|nr:hypothetical protein BASA81_008456 [Batrachochytrium salamandrivorans]